MQVEEFSEARRRAAILSTFQRYLNASDDEMRAAESFADLGVDSIVMVTALLDLADEFHLDLSRARVELKDLRTVDDIVSLMATLRVEQQPP